MRKLASEVELHSPAFRGFVAWINAFAHANGLRVHTNWSKIWEYPWSWQHLAGSAFPNMKVLDIGSEISPMPWFFASLGAQVLMVETDDSFQVKWRALRDACSFQVDWRFTQSARIPADDASVDLVTSYSVIEHLADKEFALDEAVRVLKPGGTLCLTFDICEESLGMTFPEWNGRAWSMGDFDRTVWNREDLEPLNPEARWNLEDIEPFLQWHRGTAPHHNYIVGGALFRKRKPMLSKPATFLRRRVRAHQIDTGVGSGNIGDEAMFRACLSSLPPELDLSVETHSRERASALHAGVQYVSVDDRLLVEQRIREAEVAFLAGDTPVMDAWGLEWPLRANAWKLSLCHKLNKPVHALGVGVDLLQDPEALRIFEESYRSISSWSVRSNSCKQALIEMGVSEERIILGADWAWLLRPRIDSEWACARLLACGAEPDRPKIGVNLVNEIWLHRGDLKQKWASFLDHLIDRCKVQVLFFSNETREGSYFDSAASEEVRNRMRRSAVTVTVPPLHYEPDQMISLISQMQATISLRYHFSVFSVLAGVCPLSVLRGQKMIGLQGELCLPGMGTIEDPDFARIESELLSVLREPGTRLAPLRICGEHLKMRALNNLALFRCHLEQMQDRFEGRSG